MVSKSIISEENDKISSAHTCTKSHIILHPIVHSAVQHRDSVSQSVADAEEELTQYFQAAVANSISSIQAPVDTMEQQAKHCQMGKMQGAENRKIREKRKEEMGEE